MPPTLGELLDAPVLPINVLLQLLLQWLQPRRPTAAACRGACSGRASKRRDAPRPRPAKGGRGTCWARDQQMGAPQLPPLRREQLLPTARWRHTQLCEFTESKPRPFSTPATRRGGPTGRLAGGGARAASGGGGGAALIPAALGARLHGVNCRQGASADIWSRLWASSWPVAVERDRDGL